MCAFFEHKLRMHTFHNIVYFLLFDARDKPIFPLCQAMVLVGSKRISPIIRSFLPFWLSTSILDLSSFTLRSGLDDSPLEKKVLILMVLPKARHQVLSIERYTVDGLRLSFAAAYR